MGFFHNSEFYGEAYFSLVKFKEEVSFNNSKFFRDTYFDAASFNSNANFLDAKIFGSINFNDAEFHNTATFCLAKFEKSCWFSSALFKKNADFYNTEFFNEPDFNAITSEGAFSLEKAEFHDKVPNFVQANFKEAPRFDNIKFGDDVAPGNFKNSITTFIHPDIKARYQALKRLAVQAHDHENEQRFWAGELRSDRSLKHEDGSWNWRPVFSAFWWGNIAYEFLSNHGRSIVLPLTYFLVSILIMAGIHIYAHNSINKELSSNSRTKTHITKQSDLKDCNIRSSAFRAATKNGAIGFLQNPAKPSTSVRDYTCLYGTYNDNVTPKIPNSIFWIELLHTLFSAILIFLALLGIRNNFKLK